MVTSAGSRFGFFAIVLLRSFALCVLATAVVFLVGGSILVQEGGSFYYVLAGAALVVSGTLLWQRRRSGAVLQGLILLATLAWAIWETGLDIWGLLPRVIVPALPNVILVLPGVRRVLIRDMHRVASSGARAAGVLIIVTGVGLRLALPPLTPADPAFQAGTISPGDLLKPAAAAQEDGEWKAFGNDPGGTRFSPLTSLRADNVADLRPAWIFHLGPSSMLESPPLMIGRTLYLCTDKSDVVALDAETGKLRCRFFGRLDPKIFGFGPCRGVTYFKVPGATGPCSERIITNTKDARLIAFDSATGTPCTGFGANGVVSLLDGIAAPHRTNYRVTSAPTVARGKIVVGGSILDNINWGTEPSGVVRAFDAITGKLVWAWDIGRQPQSSATIPKAGFTPSTPNAWAPMSSDESLGLVYVPTGSPIGADYFGGFRRSFDEKYANAVVALDIETGQPRWSFQTSHHDLWDYDVASQPTLLELPTKTGRVPALVQPTKRGEIFVLDRRNGRPIFPVEERRVPRGGAVPQERPSPTQPFSVGLPSFRGPDLTERRMWGLTPFDQLYCRILFRKSRYDGPNTLPGLTPAIHLPGPFGGSNWSGIAVDPTRNILIANTTNVPTRVTLIARPNGALDDPQVSPVKGARTEFDQSKSGSISPQRGTPFALRLHPFLSPLQLPCPEPPYGNLSAVDLTSGKLVWTKTFGTSQDGGPFGMPTLLPVPVGTPNIGGAVVTGSGLVFIGATQDQHLRAFETVTGRELWSARLPAGANASPITYRSPASGRQFVAILAGGHPQAMSRAGDIVIAYALPLRRRATP